MTTKYECIWLRLNRSCVNDGLLTRLSQCRHKKPKDGEPGLVFEEYREV